jgi:glutamate dehydrogenase
VLEVLNDNMPFLFDSTMVELAEQGIEVIAMERDASSCVSSAKR